MYIRKRGREVLKSAMQSTLCCVATRKGRAATQFGASSECSDAQEVHRKFLSFS